MGSAERVRLQKRLAAIYMQALRSEGKLKQCWREAAGRVSIAMARGDQMDVLRSIEEFGAYAIENYERAPRALKKWVDDLIGAIKAWLTRRFGIQLGEVTPAQLRAIAAAALRSMGVQPVSVFDRRLIGGVALGAGPLSVGERGFADLLHLLRRRACRFHAWRRGSAAWQAGTHS